MIASRSFTCLLCNLNMEIDRSHFAQLSGCHITIIPREILNNVSFDCVTHYLEINILWPGNGTRLTNVYLARQLRIESLQRRVRLILARRRGVRRLALAMALHPRLGENSPLREALPEEILAKICTEY